MEPFARLMEGAPLPGVLPTRDARPRGALVHASLAAAPHLGDKKGRHLTGTFCLTGDTMEGIIQCLVFLKAFSGPDFQADRVGRRHVGFRVLRRIYWTSSIARGKPVVNACTFSQCSCHNVM
ncbi:unnamed protein product [Colias eurytheme]|nr:unnamed protein product [Colias eurytheme]